MVKRVSELRSGESGMVDRIDRDDELGHRLMEMGILPGTAIKFLRLASKTGPIEINIRGYNLTLGQQEASSIWIRTGEN